MVNSDDKWQDHEGTAAFCANHRGIFIACRIVRKDVGHWWQNPSMPSVLSSPFTISKFWGRIRMLTLDDQLLPKSKLENGFCFWTKQCPFHKPIHVLIIVYERTTVKYLPTFPFALHAQLYCLELESTSTLCRKKGNRYSLNFKELLLCYIQ